MNSFSGKSIIVTGGSRGIGKAIALEFFRQGASVIICSRNRKELDKTCIKVDPSMNRFIGMTADVSKESDCKKLVRLAIKNFGKIDVLINNAGIIGEVGEFEKNNIKRWPSAFLVNVLGTVFMSKYVLPLMKKNGGGKIINFAGGGVGGKTPLPHFSAYYTSKMAVVGFTETLAVEVKRDNIQVNSIAPGAINTSITDYTIGQGLDKVGEEMYRRLLTQKKQGGDSLQSVLDLVIFLSSEKSSHITGRLLSAKWDKIDMLEKQKGEDNDLFKLRRIDDNLFFRKRL